MADTRVRILCGTMSAGMIEVRRLGLKALDPRWCFALFPSDLQVVPAGAHAVDLTHLPDPHAGRPRALRQAAVDRGLRLVSVHHLARLPPYKPGTG